MSLQVLVVGAGIMGAGIAQVAAQAGHPVRLFDLREGAAAGARQKLEALDAAYRGERYRVSPWLRRTAR